MTKPLNPGSPDARDLGCTCPVLDNGHGAGRGGNGEEFGWYVRGDCPLHGEGTATWAKWQED